MNNIPPVVSHLQIASVLEAKDRGLSQAVTSLDLGLSESAVILTAEGVVLPDGQRLSWGALEKVRRDKKKCFVIENNQVEAVAIFSPLTKWVRTLYPTPSAPTMITGGFFMHRVKDTDPVKDTRAKIKTLGTLEKAKVLDTSTGLGYTAIEAFRQGARYVDTVEVDPTAIEVARLNPWSKELFYNRKITQIIGDVSVEIKDFRNEQFTHIIHDPPTFKLAGQLYSLEFYRELQRVLRQRGVLFHYIGDPDSPQVGKIYQGVVRRLKEAGFYRIEKRPQAYGVVAIK